MSLYRYYTILYRTVTPHWHAIDRGGSISGTRELRWQRGMGQYIQRDSGTLPARSVAPFVEEVVALVVDDDERREVLDLDFPHRFHSYIIG